MNLAELNWAIAQARGWARQTNWTVAGDVHHYIDPDGKPAESPDMLGGGGALDLEREMKATIRWDYDAWQVWVPSGVFDTEVGSTNTDLCVAIGEAWLAWKAAQGEA